MLGKDGALERLDLAERDGSHSGSLKPEAEAANSAEEVEDIHLLSGVWQLGRVCVSQRFLIQPHKSPLSVIGGRRSPLVVPLGNPPHITHPPSVGARVPFQGQVRGSLSTGQIG